MLVDALAPKHYFNIRHRDTKQRCQKAHHVVGGLAVFGGGGHADLELRALGFANGVLGGGRFAQDVDDQYIAVPAKKGVTGAVADCW